MMKLFAFMVNVNSSLFINGIIKTKFAYFYILLNLKFIFVNVEKWKIFVFTIFS